MEEITLKVHLISNMYPSEKAPNYGIFVKNTEKILNASGMIVEKTTLEKQSSRISKLISYFLYYFSILWKGITNNYDITYVHYASHNALPLLVLKKVKKSTVIYTNVHGSDVVPEVPSQEKYQKLVRKLLSVSNVIITPSNYYRELVRSKYNLSNRIEVFPSGGVNSSVFYDKGDSNESKLKLNIDPNRRYIGYVSRLDVGKGWDILLEAFHNLDKESKLKDDVSLLVVGDGKDRAAFELKIKQYNLQQKITHFTLLPQEQLNTIYNAIDVFCFPTTRKGESLGLVGLEAMACGVPVIGSSIGGLLDYINNEENGFLFQTGSGHDLAKKIEHYFSLPPDKRVDMSENAKQKAEEYEVNTIKEKLITIFKSNR
jgi:L-malate glycosyltransferase